MEEQARCRECKKSLGKNSKGVQCEQCEMWFHCSCEKLHEDSYKLLGQDKIHFYCSRCDKAVAKFLTAIVDLQQRQESMTLEIGEMKEQLETLKNELVVVKGEIQERKKEEVVHSETVMKEQNEFGIIKMEIEKRMDVSIKNVKDDFEESLEIERRKNNLVVHGVPESDAEQDVKKILELFDDGLHMDFNRHVENVVRIGRLSERPRPIRLKLKSNEGRKEILARARELKNVENYKRWYISPDLTKRQQVKDKRLRGQLRTIREEGEQFAVIKNGRIVKRLVGGQEIVLYEPPDQDWN